MEEGVVGKTNDERFYYDDLGFKALETKFVRGYSMIFIVPIVIAILVSVRKGDLNGEAKIVCVYNFLFIGLSSFCGRK